MRASSASNCLSLICFGTLTMPHTLRGVSQEGEKAMKTNNAPSDWTPAGAAYESASDSTTLREDLRFAAEALGFRELLASLEDPREEALALLGGAMMALGFLLLALGA